MPIELFICFMAFNFVTAQINGEFWWLNNELAKLKNVEPPRPKFDDIGQFDTDDSAKVVFRDNVYKTDVTVPTTIPDITTAAAKEIEAIIYFKDSSKISITPNVSNTTEIIETANNKIGSVNETKLNRKKVFEDILNFEFNDDEIFLEKNVNKINEHLTTITPKNLDVNNVNKSGILNDKILFDTEKDTLLSENICTYMTKTECNNCNGISYIPEGESNAFTFSTNSQRICCILPLAKRKSSKIYFPDSIFYKNRLKRSEDVKSESPALKQRERLMQRKYVSQNSDTEPTATTSQKNVTPEDEYVDPYWNIKNSKLKHEQQEYQIQEYNNDYVYNDYYAAELPKPSLVGLYSDHRPPSWTFIHPHKGSLYANDEGSEQEIGSPGYSTIDPRLGGSSSPVVPNLKRRLLKFSTSSENMLNSESYTVSYHSNPDFQVLQGFKLLNLMDKKSSRPAPNSRRSTTESPIEITDEEFEPSIDNDYDDYIESTEQLYKNCGRTNEGVISNYNCESELGESSRGAHPWLLLAVLTNRQQSILCYATLIHPRAAVTAADCTYGMSPGEITVIAGIWNLKERRSYLQYRIVSVHVHQQYIPGKLAYNIALLHWRRPLRLDSHVQPACIADTNVDDDCMFVGWGGYDQGIRQRPRWQKASILSPKNCDELISSYDDKFDLPIDTFCVSVESKTTVTGPGGPLLCKVNDVFSMAGFAVWRNNVVVLMRAQEWTARAMTALRIH